MTVVTIEDTSSEISPVKVTQIPEVIYLKSTDEPHDNAQREDVIDGPEDIVPATNSQNAEEEYIQATTSPATSSISDLHPSDF